MATIKQTTKKTTKKTYRKSKQTATVKKDSKGKNHCSACGAYISR